MGVKHTKTFKRYGEQFKAEVVDATRSWAEARPEAFSIYQDASIIKVTADQELIDEMVESLRSRFGTPLPGEDE